MVRTVERFHRHDRRAALETAANQIRLMCASGCRAAFHRKSPSASQRPTIIMK